MVYLNIELDWLKYKERIDELDMFEINKKNSFITQLDYRSENKEYVWNNGFLFSIIKIKKIKKHFWQPKIIFYFLFFR